MKRGKEPEKEAPEEETTAVAAAAEGVNKQNEGCVDNFQNFFFLSGLRRGQGSGRTSTAAAQGNYSFLDTTMNTTSSYSANDENKENHASAGAVIGGPGGSAVCDAAEENTLYPIYMSHKSPPPFPI